MSRQEELMKELQCLDSLFDILLFIFPGGKLDRCDLSLEWPKYLSSLSTDIEQFSKKTADIYYDIDH